MVKPGQKVIISLPLSRTMLVRHPAWASKLERSPINPVIRGPVLICMHGHHSVCRHASSPVVLPSAAHSFKKVVALVLDTSCCPLSGAQFTTNPHDSSHRRKCDWLSFQQLWKMSLHISLTCCGVNGGEYLPERKPANHPSTVAWVTLLTFMVTRKTSPLARCLRGTKRAGVN